MSSGPWEDYKSFTPAPASNDSGPWDNYAPTEAPKKASWWDTISAIPGTTIGQLKQASGGLLRSLAESDQATQALREKTGDYSADYWDENQPHVKYLAKKEGRPVAEVAAEYKKAATTDSLAAQYGAELAKEGSSDIEAYSPGDLTFWKKAVLNGGSSVLSQIPMLALSIAARNPTPSLAAAAGQQYGQTYAESREKGLGPERAGGHAAIDATAEAAFELIPTKFLVDHAGGPVMNLLVGTMLREVPTEVMTTAVQSANAKFSTRPDMTWQEYGQDLLDTVGSTMVSAPLLAGAGAAANRMGNREKQPFQAPGQYEPSVPLGAPDMQASLGEQITGQEGTVNAPLTGPNIDEPTAILDADTKRVLEDLANGVDPLQLDDNALTESRRVLEEHQKQQKTPPLPGTDAAWSQIATAPAASNDDLAEFGASSKSAANAINYPNENTVDRLDRTFLYGPEGYAGLTPRQVMPKPGTYSLGVPSDDRPADYLRALHDTVEQWRQEFLPNETIVLSNEQLFSNSALGWHYQTPQGHMIVPAVLRKPSRGLGQYNPNTQASAFYNATHEFGHALITSKFFEGMSQEVVNQIKTESQQGVVTASALPAPQAAVVAEYNRIKGRVLDNSMTAQEFVEQWMGPAKIGRKTFLKDLGVAPTAKAMDVVNALTRKAVENSTIQNEVGARALRKRLAADFLSLEEYLAEQVARHAYQRKWDQASPLGQFFKSALDSLRNFFVARKADGTIKAGTAFQEWLDGIGKSTRAPEAAVLAENKAKAGTRAAKKGTPAAKISAAGVKKAKVKKVAHNVQSSTKNRTVAKAFANIKFLEKNKTINAEQANNLRDLANREEWDEFIEEFQKHAVKNVKFELDIPAEKRTSAEDPEWKKQRFDSRFFKAWFGDWRNDAENASVARVGVFLQGLDGSLTIDRGHATPPLVVFAAEERIGRGDSVVFSGTLRGIHHIEAHAEDPIEKATFIPVVLNLRMPYIVDFKNRGHPSIEQMKQQGYDGVVFLNGLEGHISFATFDANQVKVLDDRSPYPKDTGMHLELDYDTATPEGRGASMMWQGVKNFLNTQGPLRRALRRVIGGGQQQTLQMQQLAHIYPDLADLQFFVNTNTRYNTYKASRQALPDRILSAWKGLGKENYKKVNKILQDEAEGKQNWFELAQTTKQREGRDVPWWEFQMSQNALDEISKRGVDVESDQGKALAAHILAAKNSLLDSLNEDEQILIKLYAYRMGHQPKAFQAAINLLKKNIHDLRQAPFFPQGRFGNMMLTIEKRKPSGDGFEVSYREAFEKEADWIKAHQRAEAAYRDDPNTRVRKHLLTDTQYVLMSLPKDFIDLATSELGLSDEQLETLQQILQPVKQEKMLSQYEIAKTGLKGYSADAARSYANFTWHHANLQAKLLYRADFNLAISGMRSQLRAAEYAGAISEVQRLSRVTKMMESSRDYVMSPPNEMQSARALVSVAYLWLNIKTAAMNFYGLVTVLSDLSTEFGVLNGGKRFAQANWSMIKSMKLTDLNDRRRGDYLAPDVQKGLDRAIEEGVLSQSYAYHLAGMANSTNLARMPGYQMLGQVTQKGIDLGMYPFRLVELATRRVAFISALQEELDRKDAGFDEAYTNAVAKVNKLQNDYSLGNRVPFMRGGAMGLGPTMPLATIFASFAQHMAFHGFGGYELGQRRAISEAIKKGELPTEQEPKWYQWGYGYTARIWLLTLLLAGYEGLPGMENFLDLLEFAWRKSGAKKGFRQELREFIQAIDGLGVGPEGWARGLGHNVLGFDISRSLGFGRIFPGTDSLAKSAQENTEEMVGSVALDMMGPAGGVVKFGLALGQTRLFGGSKPLSEAGKRFPGGIGNIWTAVDWDQNGVRGPNGGLITLENGKPRDLTTLEIYGKALGFNPAIVAENREKFYVSHDRQMYWQAKRKGLLDDLNRADWQGDAEGKADAKRAISEFNASLPEDPLYKGLKIAPKDISQSLASHRRGRRAEEKGEPTQKRYKGLHQDIRRSFDPL